MKSWKINQTGRDIEVLREYLKDIPDCYVEIGVQFGSSIQIARETTSQNVYGVDIDLSKVEDEVRKSDIVLIKGKSVEIAETWDKPIGAFFIAGDHKVPKEDFDAWEKFVVSGGLVMFHDCWSDFPEIMAVCDKVRQNPNYKVVKEPNWEYEPRTSIMIFKKK